MLAVNYKRNQKLYEEYGMFKKSHLEKVLPFAEQSGKLKKEKVLQYEMQDAIFNILETIASRHSGKLPQVKVLAKILSNVDVTLNTKNKLTKTEIETIRSDTKGKLKTVLVKETQKEDVDDINIEKLDIPDLVNLSKIISASNTMVPIIFISSERFELRTPSFMLQLKSFTTIHIITQEGGLMDSNDVYFIQLFKRWLIPNVSGEILNKRLLKTEECVIVNRSQFSASEIKKMNSLPSAKFWNMTYSTVTCVYGIDKISINTRLIFEDMMSYVNKQLIDIYHMVLLNGRTYQYDTIGLSKYSIVTKVESSAYPYSRYSSLNFISKVLSRLMNQDNLMISLVVIANKGTGKSYVLNNLVEKIKTKYEIEVGHLSSDTYGRWSFKHRGLSFDDEILADLTFSEAVEISDNEALLSCYEVYGIMILNRYNILTKDDYIKSSYRTRQKCISFMSEYFLKHLEGSTKYGEDYFYDHVLTSSTRPRFVILETHCTTQNAVIGRTDTTCTLSTIADSRKAVFERDRGGPEQILLHDMYALLNSNLYTNMYPYELFDGFGVDSLILK